MCDFLGCVAPEERCLSTWEYLNGQSKLAQQKLFLIQDVDSSYSNRVEAKNNLHIARLRTLGCSPHAIERHALTEAFGIIINAIEEFIRTSSGDVALDISCLPKRLFFPILNLLFKSDRIYNLLVTYTVPAGYSDNKLAERNDEWAPLPTFGALQPHVRPTRLVVNVGFMAMGLDEQVAEQDWEQIYLLFPFPAEPPTISRSWEFVRSLESQRRSAEFELYHTDPMNLSDAFNRLVTIGSSGPVILAPFGPKTISAAMCLYATLTGSEVYYAQPTVYRHDYSIGVAQSAGAPSIFAYWIRMNGKNFYQS